MTASGSTRGTRGTGADRTLLDRMHDRFHPADGPGVNPPSQIVQEVTLAYLDAIDPADPPSPRMIESQLVGAVNSLFLADNASRAANNKITLFQHLSNYQIAQIVLRLHHVIRIAPNAQDTDREYDLLAMYAISGPNRGVYISSEDEIRTTARRYYAQMTTTDFKEILAILHEDSPRTMRCHDRDLIAVNNGVFDYRTKQLLDFDPSLVFLSKSHVDYDPAAVSPVITDPVDQIAWEVEEWMRSLSDDPEIVELCWEILGAIIRPHVRWNKSAWFYSEQGNNGKGTLCELMRNLTGPGSYTSIPLSEFGKDFALEPLVRASAIIVDENDVGTFVDRAANLKAIVTNDVLQINRKYRRPIAYQFYGFMVQCLNEFPRVKDKSESFYRRQLFVPFEKCFSGSERRYIKDDYLKRPEVLRYVLKRVLHMDYYQLSEPVAAKEVLAEYKVSNDPVREWWEEFRDRLAWDLVPFVFGYDVYRAWTVKTNPSGSALSQKAFIQALVTIVQTDPEWSCPDRKQQIRPGRRMNASEPLIATYDLTDWMNPGYSGSDLDKKCRPALSASYRGIQRVAPIPGTPGTPGTAASTAATDDEED